MFLYALFLSLLSWFGSPEVQMSSDPVTVYISTNNGKSWESFAEGLPNDLQVLEVLEHQETIYLTAIGSGVYVLEKGSDTWVKRNTGLPIELTDLPLYKKTRPDFFPTSIAAQGDRIVIGSFDDGTYYSDNKGKSWTQATTNIKDVVGALLFTEDLLLAGTHHGIWQSSDGGVNWEMRCETGFRINALAMHNNQLHVARQNGMGILTDTDIEWADMETAWAIIELRSHENQLYAISAKQEVYRTKTGEFWENNKFAVKSLPATNVVEALWGGLNPQLPEKMPAGLVTETSRGWIVSLGGGC